ncbi:Hypothetical protein PHPALM_5162 [Phytophthora palmivora]|uniref:Reverse transcriptase RNase H-like domain-containing protein n=1 Tax=Phytophthora palmivora TaxID=4796 RepID=A0A2P4YI14_9STRA|nr:Hypothetical protein PHPALM_5162 [Phytophthora palmivora]
MLAYPDTSKQMIVMSYASDVGWGLVISQVKQWNPDTQIHEQDNELLVCMGGSFSGSALNWSVIEKESFPIVHACERLENLLLRPHGFKLYCDHRNIVYLFAPGKELKKHVRGKLLRWSTKLLEYRWGGKPLPTARIHSAKRVIRHKRKRSDAGKTIGDSSNMVAPLRPLDQDGFVWHTMDEISTLQAQYKVPQVCNPQK